MVFMMQRVDKNLRQLTGYQLRRAYSSAMPGVNKVLAEFGLRRTTFSSLVVILSNPGLNQGQLADALAIERPNVVHIVDQLERAGLVQRTKSDEDRRAYALQPTPKGRKLHSRASNALEQHEKRLTRGLSETDLENLRHYLNVIEQNADELEASDICDKSGA